MVRGEVVMLGAKSGLEYRLIRQEWAAQLEALEFSVFSSSDPAALCQEAQFEALARDFQQGCFVGFDGDGIVAMGVGIRKRLDLAHPLHTLDDIMPPGTSSGHEPNGEWYYGTTIAVHPSHRRRGIGNELYELRKSVVRRLGLAGIAAGGVMPGFADHKHTMSADEYIDAVRRGDLVDPTLTFQLVNGFEAVCALPDYLENPRVDNYAVLIVWPNPDHEVMADRQAR